MKERGLLLKGVLWLFGVPILTAIFTFLFLYVGPSWGIPPLPLIAVVPIVLQSLTLFILSLYLGVSYSDLDTRDMVVVPNAPRQIAKLLKETTRGTNRLINVEIISVLGRRPLIQSRVVECVQKKGINLTSTRIIEYLSKLEKLGIIHSEKGYKRTYSLTKKGKWCREAIRECFPRTNLWFIIRYYLGIRRLPTFPDKSED